MNPNTIFYLGLNDESRSLLEKNNALLESLIERIDNAAYSPKEVAEKLSVSVASVYKLINSNKLEELDLGGPRRVTAKSLHALLAKRQSK